MPAVILVAGSLANRPLNSGGAWTRLSWLLGLRQLGFETYFLEELQQQHCVDTEGRPSRVEDSVNLKYFKKILSEYGLLESASLIDPDGQPIAGLCRAELLDLASSARCLVNISGQLRCKELLDRLLLKIYLDQDPGFTQVWHMQGYDLGLQLHDMHFTVGENVGKPFCAIPTAGFNWRRTRQPVVLREWKPLESPGLQRFTTVASWRGPFGEINWDGRTYGPKGHQFCVFAEMPNLVDREFEIALDIHAREKHALELLAGSGWTVTDPRKVVPSPTTFRSYVQGSDAEFSVAHSMYAETRSGWFSDRTTRYLASGKPVLVQETGFSFNYPTGTGVVPFQTLEEAVRGAEEISRHYEAHCHAARTLAEQFFDSDKVLPDFFAEAGVDLR